MKYEKNLKTVSCQFREQHVKPVSPQFFKSMLFDDIKKIFLDVGYVEVCNNGDLLEANEIEEEFFSHHMNTLFPVVRTG